ncbi:hypothetical protein KIS1582_4298 [Cytobacillus firmus]|uniref:Uncharacterized protein n=1 Tax=Cytobacillus firmus TaxID=1399 RepID=A0A800MT11_CYTFI|nr:hypothetical protein KIS1582_4298 [Cytobacillus firmus]
MIIGGFYWDFQFKILNFENARKVWDRKINLERLKEVTRYERKEQNID